MSERAFIPGQPPTYGRTTSAPAVACCSDPACDGEFGCDCAHHRAARRPDERTAHQRIVAALDTELLRDMLEHETDPATVGLLTLELRLRARRAGTPARCR
jgi:hypothetical protein